MLFFLIRYIEGLRVDKFFISDWDKNLIVNVENTSIDLNRFFVYWLVEGSGYYGNIFNVLWVLRDFMLKDILNIFRILLFEVLCKFVFSLFLLEV